MYIGRDYMNIVAHTLVDDYMDIVARTLVETTWILLQEHW